MENLKPLLNRIKKTMLDKKIKNRQKSVASCFKLYIEKLNISVNDGIVSQIDKDFHIQISRISAILNDYCNGILSLDIKNSEFELNLNKLKVWLRNHDLGDLASQVSTDYNLKDTRVMLKRLASEISNKDTKIMILNCQIEVDHYYKFNFVYKKLRKLCTEKSKKNLKQKLQIGVLINSELILNKMNIELEEIFELNKNKSKKSKVPYSKLACIIALATGRRQSEIIKTASFTLPKNGNNLVFSGALKKRVENNNKYLIPCLIENVKLVKAFKILRAYFKNKTINFHDITGVKQEALILDEEYKFNRNHTNATTRQYSRSFCNAMSVFLSDYSTFGKLKKEDKVEFKISRAIYTAIAVKQRNKSLLDRETDTAFKSRILCHEKEDTSTQAYYSNMIINNDLDTLIDIDKKTIKKTTLKKVVPKIRKIHKKKLNMLDKVMQSVDNDGRALFSRIGLTLEKVCDFLDKKYKNGFDIFEYTMTTLVRDLKLELEINYNKQSARKLMNVVENYKQEYKKSK